MTTPRSLLVDDSLPGYYHLVSRCVRRAWLCGRHDGQNFSHRKLWLEERLQQLAQIFPVSIYAQAIMSNHFHLVVYVDPRAVAHWSDEVVVDRWLRACPPKTTNGEVDEVAMQQRRMMLIADPITIVALRKKLSSLSVFMKLLKQPIARRANLEDGCLGHFFEKRFYSGVLLDLNAVVAAMAYVDLNPIRANIAKTLQDGEHTSIAARLRGSADFDTPLAPIVSGLDDPLAIPLTLREYVDRLETLIPASEPPSTKPQPSLWQRQVELIKIPQRAFGSLLRLTEWIAIRGFQLRERPLS